MRGNYDGILGLAPISSSASHIQDFIKSLHLQAKITKRSFSIEISDAGRAFLHLGDDGSALSSAAEVKGFRSSSATKWALQIMKVRIEGFEAGDVAKHQLAIIDSSMSKLILPERWHSALRSHLLKQPFCTLNNETDTVACQESQLASLPRLQFLMNNEVFTIEPHHYFEIPIKNGGVRELAVDNKPNFDDFIMGIPFLRAYQSTYNL